MENLTPEEQKKLKTLIKLQSLTPDGAILSELEDLNSSASTLVETLDEIDFRKMEYIKGEKGDEGIQGEQGIQGIQGEKGEQGIQGEKGEAGKNGVDGIGLDANEDSVVEKVISKLDLPEYKETILDDAGQIRDKLETLKEDERLDKNAIKGLDKLDYIDEATLSRATSILDSRTSFLIQKVSNLSDKLDASGVADGVNLSEVAAKSLTTPNSLYTMTSGIPVEFRSSDGNTILYLDETNESVGVGTNAPLGKLHAVGGAGAPSLIFGGATTATAVDAIIDGYGTGQLLIRRNGTTEFSTNVGGNSDQVFSPSGTTRLTIPGGTGSFLMAIGTLTGSSATSGLTLTQTYNTSGVIDGTLKLAITDTASGAGSLLMAIYGGASGTTLKMNLDMAGWLSVKPTTSEALIFRSWATISSYTALYSGEDYIIASANGASFYNIDGGIIFAAGAVAKSVMSSSGWLSVATTAAPTVPLDVTANGTTTLTITSKIIGGTSNAAGGFKIGAYDGNYGGIWSNAVTPSITNYALIADSTQTYVGAATTVGLAIAGNGIFNVGAATTSIVLGTVGGSSTFNALAITQTLNTSGNVTGTFRVAIVNTASDAASLLVNFLAGASGTTSMFSINMASGGISTFGKIINYNSVATAGWGVATVYGAGTVTAQVARSAAIATYTVGAADGTFEVGGNINVSASATHSFSLDVDYTDETNTARTLILPMAQLAGAFVTGGLVTNVTGTGPYEAPTMTIRCKASTAITIRPSNGTFTSVTYSGAATIKQIA